MEAATAVAGPARHSARDTSAAWRLSDRIGLAICWLLGGLFCALAAAIVIFMFVQGVRYVRPELLFTRPAVGFAPNPADGLVFLVEPSRPIGATIV